MGKIEHARSCDDGIVFYSTKIPFFGVKSCLSKSGKIYTEPVFTPFEEFSLKFDVQENRIVDYVRFIVCLLLIGAAIFSLDGLLVSSAIIFTFFVSKKLFFLLYQSYCMRSKFGSKRSVGRFHAAEHMAINAYTSLKRIPTLEEVKKYSKFSEYCGSMIMINSLILNLNSCMISLLYLRLGFVAGLIITVITNLILIYAQKHNAFMFLQNLVLTRATDAELSVAIAGLEYLEKLETQFETNGMVFSDDVNIHVIPIKLEIRE